MPFTFSHPAAILPLTYLPSRWVSLTGLVIGSLTPDFEYFLRMQVHSIFSHTIEGLFWFDLPLGLLLTFIFHNIVRDPLLLNLPAVLKSRVDPKKHFNWNEHFKRNWFVVTASILLGAASRIIWDNFTHRSGYFVELIPALTETTTLLCTLVPNYKILQHLSTLIGGLVILIAFYRLPKGKHAIEGVNSKYWMLLTGFTLTILVIRLIFGLNVEKYGNVIVTIILAGLISLVLTPITMNLFRDGRNIRPDT